MNEDQPEGIDPRVLRAKADATRIDAGQRIQDMRIHGMRMAFVVAGALLLAVAGLLVPNRTVAISLLAVAAIGVLTALLFVPKHKKP